MGPMVMSSVLLDSQEDEYFKKIGVKDSKELLPEKRDSLYSLILERVSRSYSYHLSSLSIDKLRKQGLSMNRIEENHILNLLSRFLDDDVDEVIVDAFVSKKNRLDTEVRKLFPNSVVKCEFHADANYICVAAASVIAKVSLVLECYMCRWKEIELWHIYRKNWMLNWEQAILMTLSPSPIFDPTSRSMERLPSLPARHGSQRNAF